jgi:predicted ATP-dependent endonuclease of OLD family
LHSFDDLNGGKTTTAIGEILNIMFEEVRSKSTNYNEAQKYLTALEKEMNPSDGNTEFGKLIENVNSGFEKVFSRARFHVSVDLSSPQDSIKPQFKTAFSSNIKTKVENQGTGLSRSAIFSLLKFRADWLHEKESKLKTSLFIAFEEPELYLHPAAIRQIREFIYEISESGETQIVCSTHSANMIDLSREKILQVINLLKVEQREFPFDDKVVQIETPRPFIIAHSTIMSQLEENDRSFLKMLLKVDQSIAESFFCERTIIIEGDTEQVVLSETLNRVPREQKDRILKKHNIVRARGKIIIKPLVKYLKALGIDYRVIHDKDNGKDGQENANELIKAEAGADNVYVIDDCIETVLGYSPPSKEKPYKAYQHIQKNWGNDSTKMSDEWKKILKFLFNESF